jgi:flagellar protein FlgJ
MSEMQAVVESSASRPPSAPDRLREAAHDLEGVFLSQMFKAMRDTVPREEGLFGSSEGEDMFSEMLDEVFGKLAAQQLKGGVGDALYRQLSRHFNVPEETAEL